MAFFKVQQTNLCFGIELGDDVGLNDNKYIFSWGGAIFS